MARFLRTETNSSGGHSRLRGPEPPIVFPPAAPFVARPTLVHLAPSPRQGRKPLSGLGDPVVIGAGIAFHGPGVRLADPLSPNFLNRRKANSRFTGVVYAPKVYAPISGFLTPPRDRNPKTQSRLAPPTVVTPESTGVARPIRVTLTRIRPFPTDASVFKPVVVGEAQGPQGGIGIQLAPSFRGKAKSFLRPSAVVTAVATDVFFGPQTTLTYSKRGKPLSGFGEPVVISPKQFLHPIATTLAYSTRGKPKSFLRAPVVVTAVATDVFFGPKVKLAKIKPVRTISRLQPPAVVAPVLARPTVTHLAYSSRGEPKARLAPPTVVAPVLAPQVNVTLARIKPAAIHSVLRRPTDLVDQQDLGFVRVHLAYSRRGTPKSVLRKPTVVAPVLARRVDVTFAPQKRGVPKSVLHAPTVVAPVLARQILTRLVRIKPAPVHSVLRRPVDLVDSADVGFVRVQLARIRPVLVHPVLRKPVVIDLRPQTKFLGVNLTYSRRGKPKSVLQQASLFAPVPKAERVLAVTLAYSRRGKPTSKLRLPVVVTAATPYLRPIDVTLAPQARGKAKPRLAPPTVFAPVPPVQGELRGGRRLRLESIYDEDDWLAVILDEV